MELLYITTVVVDTWIHEFVKITLVHATINSLLDSFDSLLTIFLPPFLPAYSTHGIQSDTFKPKLYHDIPMLKDLKYNPMFLLWSLRPYTIWSLPNSLTSSLRTVLLIFHHTSLLTWPGASYEHSNFKIFTLVVSSYWNVLCQIPAWLILLFKTPNGSPLSTG